MNPRLRTADPRALALAAGCLWAALAATGPARADAPDGAAGAPVAAPPSAATPAAAATAVPPTRSETLLPRVDVYFPEGDFDLRLGRFIKNALFEGQFKYNFVKGDITAFLRYRYYGFDRIFTLGLFDAVEFEAVEKLSNEFTRVRGGSVLLRTPFDFHRRAFLLAEVDRISSSKEELRYSTNRTNTFVRFGYQLGTPRDERSNAIVGETRARIQQLFSAHRDIGPRGAGLTLAATWSFDQLWADFDYLKFEFDALRRYSLGGGSFFIHRVHGGTFARKSEIRGGPEVLPEDAYSIPRSELFRLDGRENLKGLKDRLRGTENLQTTLEVFVPWFDDASRRALGVDWQSFYVVLYAGAGTIGFERAIYTRWDAWRTDAGFGFESAFRLKNYTFFLSGIVAQTLDGEGGPKGKVSIKSFH